MNQTDEQQPLIEKGCLEHVRNHCFRNVNYAAYILSIIPICFLGGLIITLIGASIEFDKLSVLGGVIMLISFVTLPFCMMCFQRLEKEHLENNV